MTDLAWWLLATHLHFDQLLCVLLMSILVVHKILLRRIE